jgi:hypothetical protein
MRSAEEVQRVLHLATEGLNQSQIARTTGIPRGTIRDWLHGRIPDPARWSGGRRRGRCMRCDGLREPFPFSILIEHGYAYLLGLYLGDGCISLSRRGVYRLRVFLDRAYPLIVEECAAAMSLAMPTSKASVYRHRDERMSEVSSFSKHWPCLFPQHGPGLKHLRTIRLENWQREIADRYPARLLRGLIHSDGSRGLNTIKHPKKTYAYPRYYFSNRSADIRAIFCEYCEKIGVEWRQMNRFDISVARSESVARLDRFVGPKR